MNESAYPTSNTSTDKGRKISIKTKSNKNERQEKTADPRGYVWDLSLTPKRDSYHYPAQAVLDESVDTLTSQEMPRPTSRSIRVRTMNILRIVVQCFSRGSSVLVALRWQSSSGQVTSMPRKDLHGGRKRGVCGVITICAIAVCG